MNDQKNTKKRGGTPFLTALQRENDAAAGGGNFFLLLLEAEHFPVRLFKTFSETETDIPNYFWIFSNSRGVYPLPKGTS
jgi:hypothetical protein